MSTVVPTTSEAIGRRPRTAAIAKLLTDILAPAHLAIGLGFIIAWHAADGFLPGLGWGCLAVLFTGTLPYAFVLVGARRGRWADHHIPELKDRPLVLLVGALSVLVGLAVLAYVGAPHELVALVAAELAGIVVALAVSLVWKISIHASVIYGTVTVLVIVFGAWLLLSLLPAIAVSWARIALRAHTLAQVVLGGVVGAVIAGTVFTSLR